MFAAISVLLFVVTPIFADPANHDPEFCGFVQYEELCNYTFGCYWGGDPVHCTEQEYYEEDVGTCASIGTFPDQFGYECYDDGADHFIYDPTYYDSCSGEEYTTGTCPEVSTDGIACSIVYVNDTDESGYCYECTDDSTDPVCTGCTDLYATGCPCDLYPWSNDCYPNTDNAGICDGRDISTCNSIPNCQWNSSSCQPDWKCYYSYLNGIYPNNVGGNQACDSTSVADGGAGCSSKIVGVNKFCTSDPITSADENCINSGTSQTTCESANCVWVPPGTQFNGWCTAIDCPEGSTHPVCTGCITDLYAKNCPCDSDPWSPGCYPNLNNAGICENRTAFGCGSFPNCHWNSSTCQPDWKCYYSYLNGIAPNNVGGSKICDSDSGCKEKTIETVKYCTSDTITSTDEKCLRVRADKAACEAEGCEWVPPGGTGASSYEGWCTEVGSRASVTRLCSVGLIVLLSVILTFL